MIDAQQRAAALVVDAARRAVTGYAPEELEVFDGVAAGWREQAARGARQQEAPGSAVGFGIDTTLVSELFLQATSAAVTEVLVLGVTGVGAGLRARWLRRRGRDATTAEPTEALAEVTMPANEPAEPASEPEGPASEPTAPAADTGRADSATGPGRADGLGLTGPQMAALQQACRRHALALGLPADAADLLADALVGALAAPGDR
ncbi:hypothetical protein ABUL04_26995 [Micromonospora harpali]|uniref:Uncharacterized protein n=1 Tax=Micromonospora harpali TaxID=1490225 RepID=A0ABW1HQ02_9ACTN